MDLNAISWRRFWIINGLGEEQSSLWKWVGYLDATREPEEFLKNEIGEDLEPLKEYKEAVSRCV